jgi:hypothetical protein
VKTGFNWLGSVAGSFQHDNKSTSFTEKSKIVPVLATTAYKMDVVSTTLWSVYPCREPNTGS